MNFTDILPRARRGARRRVGEGRHTHEDDYHLYLVCVRLEEDKLGRQLTTSELDRFTRDFYAPSYRRDMERIPKEQWDQLHSELEHEEPSTRRKRPPRRKAG